MFFLAASIFACQLVYWVLLGYGIRRAMRKWGMERNWGVERNWGADPETGRPLPPMSVVVAARNEADNILPLLRALDRQTHPQYEIVIVDDASTDRTAEIVREFSQTRKQMPIRVVTVTDPQPPRKKHALARGIDAARFDHLAFTDADCRPAPGWLAAHAAYHACTSASHSPMEKSESQTEGGEAAGGEAAGGEAAGGAKHSVITGYSPYHGGAGLLGSTAAYETFVTGVLTAASAGLGRPYMGLGRNMSYSRELFRRADGFAHSEASLSGDDDLFVQHAAAMPGVEVVHPMSPESQVASTPPESWTAWLHQKRRHTSAGRFYRRSTKLHLALFHGTSIALWGAPLVAGLPGAALLAGKLALQYAVLRRASKAFRGSGTRWSREGEGRQSGAGWPHDEARRQPDARWSHDGELRQPDAGWSHDGERRQSAERRFSALTFPALELFYAAYNLVVAPLGLAKIPERW